MKSASSFRRFTMLAAALAWVLAASPAQAGSKSKSESKAKASFENTGVQPAAEGKIEFEGKPNASKLEIEFERLDPGPTYSLSCDGVVWASFRTDSEGEAELRFESKPGQPGAPMLPADPRGAHFALNDGAADVLTVTLNGPGEPADSQVKEKGDLPPGSLPAGVRTSTSFRRDKKGATRYEVKAQKLPAGTYSFLVNGVEEASVVVPKDGGKLKLRFADPQKRGKEMPLDFDPRGSIVELSHSSGALASGGGSPSIDGLDACVESEVEVPLARLAGVGKAESEFRVDDDCDKRFKVKVENVLEGAYDVYVDGILRGTMLAAFSASEGEVHGEIKWKTDPDDPGELLLDFDPEGALIEVKQGDTVLFSGFQTPAVPGAPGGICTETRTEVGFLNTGARPGAKGKARFEIEDDCETEFDVEIENLAQGSYDLVVGGVLRGSIVVGPFGEGDLDFETDSDDPDKLPLDFDPRGMLIEVFDGGTKILERLFPS